MTTRTAEVAERALTLGEEERADLVELLLASLESRDGRVHTEFDLVLDRRRAELERGDVVGIPWESVQERWARGD